MTALPHILSEAVWLKPATTEPSVETPQATLKKLDPARSPRPWKDACPNAGNGEIGKPTTTRVAKFAFRALNIPFPRLH